MFLKLFAPEPFISTVPYGVLNDLHGYDGAIRYFEKRAEVEKLILSKQIISSYEYNIVNNNWVDLKNQINMDIINEYMK